MNANSQWLATNDCPLFIPAIPWFQVPSAPTIVGFIAGQWQSKQALVKKMNDFKYAVNFEIYFKTKPGQEIYVLGSIPELGEWKTGILKLYWTEGHIWKNKEPLFINHPYFEYKYALFDLDEVDNEEKL